VGIERPDRIRGPAAGHPVRLAGPHSILARRSLALVAAAFGIATVAKGGSVLAGADPGYAVFRPLLLFNAAMGVAYLAAGLAAWRSLERGRLAAAAIALLNLLVLVLIGSLYAAGSAIARESLGAMAFRTGLWLALWLGLSWLARGSRAPGA